MTEATETFDYIVSGAGSAGCVVAARLSESGKHSVLLLEAGPEDKAFWIRVPMGYPMLFTNAKVNWMFESEPEAQLGGRRMYQPRGKVLGGTSSINGMLYIRGHPADYDIWARRGCTGWSYEDVLPYFRKAENQQRGADPFHGVGGPLWVSDQPSRSPIADAIVEAAVQSGLPRNADFNGARQEGAGFFQTTTGKRRRWNTSHAYLRPARRRSNFKIATGAHATRILFDGLRATGIEYRTAAGVKTAHARGEVILCGGAFGSPHLLQLSGIGPAAHLRDHDIPVLLDQPAVGSRLLDHFYTSLMFRCTRAITMNDIARSWIRKATAGLSYILFRRGILATNGIYAGVFARSHPGLDRPDIQINTNIWTVASRTKSGMVPHPFPGFTMSPVHLAPRAEGSVRLRSPDPQAHPAIKHNFFRDRADIRAMISAVRLVRTIAQQDALKPFIAGEIAPGSKTQSDEEIEAYLRANGIANLHPVGSCRMGQTDDAVVDPQLRVHGLERLRVVDASIMPTLPAGNTNAPTIMIAEKASRMILQTARSAS